jgi:asparagine synthase (glutamine-hydrolysing)
MCGIVAVLNGAGNELGSQILEQLGHRGPDDAGSLQLDGCFLAMARLAILDPTARSNQPMSWKGRHLVYNGEIYNYRALRAELSALGVPFETSGDTEVVLKALVEWGAEACERLAGMFAFALWDEHRRLLTVGRDRYGVKPLYWRAVDGGGVALASEATPLAAIGATQVRLDAVREFLRLGSPISSSIYAAVVEVQPGTVTTWAADGEVRTSSFGSRSIGTDDGPGTLRAVAGEFLLSDRPVALFLSGGFDSAAVAAAIATSDRKPVAITLATSSNGEDVDRAAATAAHYGLEHHISPVTLADTEALLVEFLSAMDQPTIDGFNTFLVSRAAVERGFPVALSGLGGDEVMGGYGYYRWQRQVDVAAAAWRHSPGRARTATATVGAKVLHRRPSEVAAILDAPSLAHRHLAWRGLFTSDEVARLTGADAPASQRWLCDPADSPRAQLSELDFQTYLRPTLLRDTDIFSMANSVEVRVPLLDERFVMATQAMPRPLTKLDVAKAWDDDYLAKVAAMPKLTFGLPWRDWIRAVVDKTGVLQGDDPWGGLLDPSEAKRFLTDTEQASRAGALRSWALVVLASWLSRPPSSRHVVGSKS